MGVLSNNQRGMLAMSLAMALYVLNDTFVKLTTDLYPTGQILAVRGLFSTMVVFGIAIAVGALPAWRSLRRPIVGLRSLLEITTAGASIAALALMPIANVTSIMLAAPLIITLFLLMARMEVVRPGRVVASFIGFAGVIMVLRPAYDAFGIGALLALVAALGLAGRDIVTRRMPGDIPSALIALVTTAAVALAGCLMAPFETWQPLVMRETLYLAAAAIFAAVGNYALILACRDVDLSAITPFRYTILLWAFIAGYVVWGDTPDLMATIGMLVIVAAGFYTVRSDRKVAKAVREPVVR